MSRKERLDAIKNLQDVSKAPVICYVTGDRHPAISAQISDDAIRVLYRHLEALGELEKIYLFLYTRGGYLMAPPRIVHLIREYCKKLYTLIPYRAHSAGTSICLGADGIVMGKMGELSPVDPSTVNPFNPQAVEGDPRNIMTKIPISVEDVTAYLSFAEKAKLISDEQKIEVFRSLTNKLDPIALGNVHRVYNIIRLHTPELLSFQLKTPEEKIRIPEITKALTETYTHDQLISRDLAEKLGLKIIKADSDVESAMWRLYEVYERDLKLQEIFDPEEILGDQGSACTRCDVAFIESMHRGDVFSLEATITRRATPTLPPGMMLIPAAPQAPRPPSGAEEFDVKLKPLGWKEIIGE